MELNELNDTDFLTEAEMDEMDKLYRDFGGEEG